VNEEVLAHCGMLRQKRTKIIIRVIEYKGMRWEWIVTRVGEKGNSFRASWGNLRQRDGCEYIGKSR